MDLQAIAHALSLEADHLTVTPLTGGVSSDIFLLEAPGGCRFVAKQALPKLRVAANWTVDPSRIWREVDALRLLAGLCAVPRVLYEDRDNHLYVMSAAPADAEPWKAQLLRGDANPDTARRIGAIQAALREQTSLGQHGFDGLGFFEDLRIEPYYTFTAQRHPDLAWLFHRATQACRKRRTGLVHGDWSPKNILVDARGEPLALDFECVHYGDPAYDTAFLLSHLLLKTFHLPETAARFHACAAAYLEPIHRIAFEDVMIHLPALLLARIDGKSPVEYLRQDSVRQRVRRFARQLAASSAANVTELWLRWKE
jgi:5-methylthioribose kinase